jgi:hypothetical protein
MATYLSGVTDFIPDYQPFQPDYNFYANFLQYKQNQYDTNWKSLSNLYGQYFNAELTNPENIKIKDKMLSVSNGSWTPQSVCPSQSFSIIDNTNGTSTISLYGKSENITKTPIEVINPPDPEIDKQEYFMLKSKQDPSLCLHTVGGSGNPYDDTRLELWNDCDVNNPSDSTLFKLDNNNNIISLRQGSCLAAHYYGNAAGGYSYGVGHPIVFDSRYCQPFEYLSNGTIRHKLTGSCIHPVDGIPYEGVLFGLYPDCSTLDRLSFTKISIVK